MIPCNCDHSLSLENKLTELSDFLFDKVAVLDFEINKAHLSSEKKISLIESQVKCMQIWKELKRVIAI